MRTNLAEHSTAATSDLARFVIGIQDSLAGKPGAVLKAETARLMVTPVKGDYGLGFDEANTGKAQRFAHNGRNDGFDTAMVGSVETGFGAVVMINANENSKLLNQVLSEVVRNTTGRLCSAQSARAHADRGQRTRGDRANQSDLRASREGLV